MLPLLRVNYVCAGVKEKQLCERGYLKSNTDSTKEFKL